jgi:demethylmenaquinone methyltransferase/2-methoxy-6-polyprenyl-1,4-benzoquinol methylase
VLRKGGVEPGQRVLDIATGTGLTAQAVQDVLQGTGLLVGLDPSRGMLQEARKKLQVPLLRGLGDRLPFRDEQFDLVTMGFAMRHLSDLERAFAEYRRVLRGGGRVLLLEISRPKTRIGMAATRLYFQRLLPRVTRMGTRSDEAKMMMDYYWDTIEQCVPPEAILAALRAAGFAASERRVSLGIFSEYWATR